MSKINSFWKFLKKKKLLVGSIILIIAIIGVISSMGGNGVVETVSAKNEDLVRTVRIAGKVIPREKADLGFEVSGTVSSVAKPVGSTVNKGEVLVRLDASSKAAEIARAEAELASAQAELQKLEGAQSYQNSITSDKRTVVQAILDAYTKASDAIENKANQMFIDPLSGNPQISGSFQGYGDLRDRINKGKVEIEFTLDEWQKLVNSLTNETYNESQLTLSKEYLSKVTVFISNLSQAVNMFVATSYMSQATIDGYKADVLAARESLNTASQGFINAESSLSQTLSDVPVQVARVEAAKASVLNLRYQLGKSTLVSPITGVVARQDAKLGQAVTGGTSLVSVISRDYIIETYVPEVSIAGIAIGNSANITLDAYGPKEIFVGTVTHIDPAETIRDGVSTYKVELAFVGRDERVRSGMTSNIEIETFRKPLVTLIPERTVVRKESEAYVYVLLTTGEKVKVPVTLGEKDSRGNIEVISGISTEESVVVNPEE